MMRISGVGHYFHAIHEGEALPELAERLAPFCRERYRRIDRFIQLALLGSAQCAQGAVLSPGCGLYISSGIGPVGNNIVVQETLWKQHKVPMPFNFVNTLGSSAGYYVAKNLGLNGQSLFISRRGASFEAALDCAAADLESGAVAQALVGAVEECTLPLAEHRQRQELDGDVALAEGSHWLLLEAGLETKAGPVLELGDWDGAFHDSVGAAQITRFAMKKPLGSLGLARSDENSNYLISALNFL
jgi:hypothetical protein